MNFPAALLARLRDAGIPDPATDLRRLFDWAYAMGKEAGPQTREAPNAKTQALFEAAIADRLRHKPVAKIIGKRAFWRHDFVVSPDVLDPRPDTETLVEIALQAPFQRVLDLGTGSGCILLSLLDERAQAQGVGVDLSAEALQVAQTNADRLNLAERVALIQSDWFEAVTGRFDLIVSNPPYISADAYEGLAADVRNWDPRIALTPGGDGLSAYRIICRDAPRFLRPRGRLLVEIGYDQGPQVMALFEAAGFAQVALTQDLNGKDRVVSGVFHGGQDRKSREIRP